jgi:hypothetical protein
MESALEQLLLQNSRMPGFFSPSLLVFMKILKGQTPTGL